MTKKERFKQFIEFSSKHRPVAETELVYRSPYEMLVATILSAQCTDKRVNIITPQFFERYPGSKELSKAKQEEVLEFIKSCSYPNNKAKHLIGMARVLENDFDGVVPSDVDSLQKLPGVGRKTANVIASVVFNIPAMAVDTHVFRVAERMGLTTNSKNPLDSERQLVKYIPEDKVNIAHHWLILHGRYVCKARKPDCHTCGCTGFCLYFQKTNH